MSFITVALQQVDVNKGCLPSPEDLKYKILIKAKRSKKTEKEDKKNGDVNRSRKPSSSADGREGALKSPLEASVQLAKKISVGISKRPSLEKNRGDDKHDSEKTEGSLQKDDFEQKEGSKQQDCSEQKYDPEEKDGIEQKDTFKEKDGSDGQDDSNRRNRSEQEVDVQNGLAKSSGISSIASNESFNDDGTNIKKGRDSEEDTAKDVNSIEESRENVSGQLNSIINCLEATKFVQLDDPDRHFWQMFSLKEEAAESLGSKQDTAMKLVSWTQKGLARVYPGNLRVDSSNFNPIPFWLR